LADNGRALAATRKHLLNDADQAIPRHFLNDTLFVFALEAEAGDVFNEVNTVFTGIGKVNAAIALTKAIATRKPKLIVNLGSAGSQRHGKGQVCAVTASCNATWT
jgi:nucleoside phosphorylase